MRYASLRHVYACFFFFCLPFIERCPVRLSAPHHIIILTSRQRDAAATMLCPSRYLPGLLKIVRQPADVFFAGCQSLSFDGRPPLAAQVR